MSKNFLSCQAQDVAACCCVDVGTVIDNSDLNVSFKKIFQSKEEAEEVLAYLKTKAQKAAFSGFNVVNEIISTSDGYVLKANFTFECQAEAIIFQLEVRQL